MASRNKLSSSKNAFQIMMKSESKLEKDSRPHLFSSNCPVRCGTSGYSYKRFVDSLYINFICLSIFSWHTTQHYYPDKNEFSYYCDVNVFTNVFLFN
jgi:hypothetical protein